MDRLSKSFMKHIARTSNHGYLHLRLLLHLLLHLLLLNQSLNLSPNHNQNHLLLSLNLM